MREPIKFSTFIENASQASPFFHPAWRARRSARVLLLRDIARHIRDSDWREPQTFEELEHDFTRRYLVFQPYRKRPHLMDLWSAYLTVRDRRPQL